MSVRLRYATSRAGLHARPAAVFVRAVLDSGSAVRIGRAASAGSSTGSWAGSSAGSAAGSAAGSVDARSIVSVLALDIKAGEAVVLIGDDEEVLDRLVALLETAPI
jgi:phosphocarrier protein HPr